MYLFTFILTVGSKYSVPCPKEASLLTLVSLMYVLEHFWSHPPWYYDPVSTSVKVQKLVMPGSPSVVG